MARKGKKSTGSLALKLALGCAAAGFVGGLLVTVAVVQNVASSIEDEQVVSRAWQIGIGLCCLAAAISGGAAWVLGGQLASRIKDVGLAVSKLGRGGSEVRVRTSGNDEVTGLGAPCSTSRPISRRC